MNDKKNSQQPAATNCVGCEGSPSANNNPCAVCGRSAHPPTPPQEAAALGYLTPEAVEAIQRMPVDFSSYQMSMIRNTPVNKCKVPIYLAAPSAQVAVPEGWRAAIHEAVTALYFDDSSDYKTALYAIVRNLSPELSAMIESADREDHSRAYHQSEAALAAAPAPVLPAAEADAASVGVTPVPLSDPWVSAVRSADNLCPFELSTPDKWRWKAAHMQTMLGQPSPVQVEALSQQAALESALDAEYPIPDSPHESVKQRAYGNRSAFERGWNAALNKQEQAAVGTFACPICGLDRPHGHSDAVQKAYREDQIRNDGWTNPVVRNPTASGWYLCRGVEIPNIHETNQKFWFNWVRQFMVESGSCRDSKTIPEVLYYDKRNQTWALRNALGDAVHSGAENRSPVYVKISHWMEVPIANDAAIRALNKQEPTA